MREFQERIGDVYSASLAVAAGRILSGTRTRDTPLAARRVPRVLARKRLLY